jgi:hypothetical protein
MTRLAGSSVAIAVVAAMVAVSEAEEIQKWRTRDGGTYYGNRPPPGSEKIGSTGALDPLDGSGAAAAPASATPAPGSASEADAYSTAASLKRRRIEKGLNEEALRLARIRAERARLEGELRDRVDDPLSSRAGASPQQKAALPTLDRLEHDEHACLGRIRQYYADFDALRAEVGEHFKGAAPSWWRSEINCPKCPSRIEVAGD